MWSLLSQEWSAFSMFITKNIIEKIKLTDKELKDNDLKENDKWITWKEWWDKIEVSYEFSENESELIKKKLKNLDAEQKLPLNLMSIYQKFLPSELINNE